MIELNIWFRNMRNQICINKSLPHQQTKQRRIIIQILKRKIQSI